MAGRPVHAAAPLTPEPGLGERAAEAGTNLIQGVQMGDRERMVAEYYEGKGGAPGGKSSSCALM